MSKSTRVDRVGIVAPSSRVPAVEFGMGVERIREAGFEPVVHPHTLRGHLFFAGTDEERADAFWEFAMRKDLPALWAARGGYGSARILPLLDARARRERRKPPRGKWLVGYSDSTPLLEYVRVRWGWRALHAPMPGLRQFCALPDSEWGSLVAVLRDGAGPEVLPWYGKKLEWIGKARPPRAGVVGPLVGGNLSVMASLVGTPHAIQARGKIVFLEDVDENLYRVDRMAQQLLRSGALRGARALVLGNFLNCRDLVPRVLREVPATPEARARALSKDIDPATLEPLRSTVAEAAALEAIFGDLGRELKIPVARGLPCGHGPEKAALPLGGKYRLGPDGKLSC